MFHVEQKAENWGFRKRWDARRMVKLFVKPSAQSKFT